MKKHGISFIVNLLISACIGLVVGMVQITITTLSLETLPILLGDALMGMGIGTLSRWVFIYVFNHYKNSNIGYILVFFIIGVISFIPSILPYIFVEGRTFSLINALTIVLVAEVLGMSLCYLSYKHCLLLNQKLDQKKRELSEKGE